MIENKIEQLKSKLNKQIEEECEYSKVLETSKEIDQLLVKYYLKDVKDVG